MASSPPTIPSVRSSAGSPRTPPTHSSWREAGSTCPPQPPRTVPTPTGTPIPNGCGSTGGSTGARWMSSERRSTTSRWARGLRCFSSTASPAAGRTGSRTSRTSLERTGSSPSICRASAAARCLHGRSQSRRTGASCGTSANGSESAGPRWSATQWAASSRPRSRSPSRTGSMTSSWSPPPGSPGPAPGASPPR